jgi:putative Mg2+ transporter-C (MgtC) family protein
MSLILHWQQVALRLALATIAGAIIGLNRGERGNPAGLRTNILVCLAACIAMVQANLLLGAAGKSPSSFVVLDLMRLPLGILTGIGFIGAGAILRKGDRVTGVTTAATLWFVTVMGLCFGGGQLGLGGAALGLGIFVLWILKWIENGMPQQHQARLMLTLNTNASAEQELRNTLSKQGYRLLSCAKSYSDHAQVRELRCQVTWRAKRGTVAQPSFVEELAHHPDVLKLEWSPSENGS